MTKIASNNVTRSGSIVLELPTLFANFTGDIDNPTEGNLFFNARGEVFVRMNAIVKVRDLRCLCSRGAVDVLPQEVVSKMPKGCKPIVVQGEPAWGINNKNDYLDLLDKYETITKSFVENGGEGEGVCVCLAQYANRL